MNSILFTKAWVPGLGQRDVGVKDSRIELVGSATDQDKKAYARVMDASNFALMPGLVNTHGHAAMTLFRGAADDLPLMDWLQNVIWPMEAGLNGDHIYWGTMLAIAEMLKGGTTTFTDMYFFQEDAARAVEDTGIRAVLCRGNVGLDPEFENKLKDSQEFAKTYNGKAHGRITTTMAPHAPYTCPQPTISRIIEAAKEINSPLQIHLSETAGEVKESYDKYGKSPVALMEEAGLFELPVVAAHCVHLCDRDIDILAKYDVRVAHNPDSNLKLGSGIAPVAAMLAKGITVGLGTDGAASNNNLDMFEEMRMAAMLQKGLQQDPTLVDANTAIKMATEMGARAVFLDDQIGAIRQGMKADLILVDLDKPHLTPRHNVEAHLVYSAQSSDVSLVMVDGKILVENGMLTTMDQERVMFEASRCAKELT